MSNFAILMTLNDLQLRSLQFANLFKGIWFFLQNPRVAPSLFRFWHWLIDCTATCTHYHAGLASAMARFNSRDSTHISFVLACSSADVNSNASVCLSVSNVFFSNVRPNVRPSYAVLDSIIPYSSRVGRPTFGFQSGHILLYACLVV